MTLEILTFETGIMTTNHTVFMKRNVIYVNIHYARHGIDHCICQMLQIIIFHHRKTLKHIFLLHNRLSIAMITQPTRVDMKTQNISNINEPLEHRRICIEKKLLNLWDQKSPGQRTIKSICWAVWWLLHVFVSQVAIHIFKLNGSILPASYVVECPSRSIRIPRFHRHRGAGTSC